jgi:hypothetical protein
VREKADKAMTMLQLQQDLLRKLKEVLPHRTVDGLNEVEELLKKSDEIDMPDHHLVTEGRKVLRDFRNAQAAARMIRENSDFRSLSRDDLHNRIDCISEFKDLLQDAAKLLDELKKHRDAFDEEIKTILPNLDLAIECEEVAMDPSGDLAPAKADKPRNKAAEVLGALDENKLISADCIVLVRDLRYYLKLRDTVIPQGKHKELLDLLAAEDATRIVHPVLVSQLALFKECVAPSIFLDLLSSILYPLSSIFLFFSLSHARHDMNLTTTSPPHGFLLTQPQVCIPAPNGHPS